MFYTEVLLQHTCYRYLYFPVYYGFPRNTYCSYPEAHFEVLRVPRVAHLDYPSHPRLCTISRDELASLFYEKAMVWGDALNFSTTEFAEGQRILNMVMTFVLTPQSHYNTITESRARFLLSFLEDLSIDFSSHMIVSMINIYRDTARRDKLIFPSTITCILTHLHVTIPSSPFFYFFISSLYS